MNVQEKALAEPGSAHLGGRLRALRRGRGFSLRELADRLGISVSAVSQIERGTLQPSVNRLLAMASALGVPITRVFDERARDGTSAAGTTGSVLARAGDFDAIELEDGVLMRDRMEVWSVAAVPIEMEPVEGEQSAGSTELGTFGGGSFGVWTITEGVSTDVEVDEVSVVLSGRGTVTDLDTGAEVQLTPGTVLRLAAGVRTRWTVQEPIRKVYVLR